MGSPKRYETLNNDQNSGIVHVRIYYIVVYMNVYIYILYMYMKLIYIYKFHTYIYIYIYTGTFITNFMPHFKTHCQVFLGTSGVSQMWCSWTWGCRTEVKKMDIMQYKRTTPT